MKVLELATDAAEEAVTKHTVGIIGSTEAGPRTSIGPVQLSSGADVG